MRVPIEPATEECFLNIPDGLQLDYNFEVIKLIVFLFLLQNKCYKKTVIFFKKNKKAQKSQI